MLRGVLALAGFLLFAAPPAQADPMLIVDFSRPEAAEGWRFFTDQVMGGVSTGGARVDAGALHLTGRVSTENRGGFIQVRSDRIALAPDVTRLRARVRGDGQVYYMHLRTTATALPWQYYQAAFTAPEGWSEVVLPLSAFKPSGRLVPAVPAASDVRSVALVAYGRDHDADVRLSRLWAD